MPTDRSPTLRRTDLFPPSAARLREAHGHIGALGEALGQPDLSTATSLDECLMAVTKAVSEALTQQGRATGSTPPWVLLRGARPAGWSDPRWPTLAELDRASAAAGPAPCPVVIMSFDHHMAMANSAALAAARLSPGQVVPPNGWVQTDADGAATGILIEQAAYAAWHSAPEPTFEQRVASVRASVHHLAGLGFAQAHDLHAPSWLGPALAELDRVDELPLSVSLYPPFDRIEQEAASARTYASPRIRLAGGKLFADGTLNSRTALVLSPYRGENTHPYGVAMHTFDQLCAAVSRCDDVNLPLAVHAIGDGAVRMTLDAFEMVRPRAAGGRIEHCELIDAADVDRFRALRVSASVQPCHLLADIEVLIEEMPLALGRVMPIRSLLESGLVPGALAEETGRAGLVFGSDVPIVRADPADSIIAAVLRGRAHVAGDSSDPNIRVVGDPPIEVDRRRISLSGLSVNPDQAITADAAWACFAMLES